MHAHDDDDSHARDDDDGHAHDDDGDLHIIIINTSIRLYLQTETNRK